MEVKDHRQMLLRAAAMAKSGYREPARQLIFQVLNDNPNTAMAWWGLARVTISIEERRAALYNVLYLRPDYEPARKMLEQTNTAYRPVPQLMPDSPATVIPLQPTPRVVFSRPPPAAPVSVPSVVMEYRQPAPLWDMPLPRSSVVEPVPPDSGAVSEPLVPD